MDNYYNTIAKGYNELHGEEQKKKLNIVKKYLKPKITETLLDIGCGTGISSDWECKVVGLDPNLDLLKQNKAEKIIGIGDVLPFKDRSFDYSISLTAIHHMDIAKAIDEIVRVTKKAMIITILKKSSAIHILIKNLNQKKMEYEIIEEDKDLIFKINLS